ncbi:hypothetical protein D9611_002076 [Ephemerocybe angulata]|uniref:Uncharacterized protein n=1 Tax=Ephemerocybe angulata TaxID=980116 RepID=A0A8H5FMN1_9AGAR|nr:hypothetical protein D9611_002076 [Tulosesus angulatus]
MSTKVLRQWCIVIQLAKISGFSYIITTASLKHTEYLKSNRRRRPAGEGLPAKVKYAYDAIGDVEASFRFALVPGGTVATAN